MIIIKDSRALEELPIKIISSAKKIEDTLMEPRLIPEPVLFSSWPKLLTKRAKNRGERLHPESMIIRAFLIADNDKTLLDPSSQPECLSVVTID